VFYDGKPTREGCARVRSRFRLAKSAFSSPDETRSTITSARGTYLDAQRVVPRAGDGDHVRLVVERQARLGERECSRKRRDAGGRVRRRRERRRSRRSIRLGRRPRALRSEGGAQARRGPSAYRLRERRGVIVHHRGEREPVTVRSSTRTRGSLCGVARGASRETRASSENPGESRVYINGRFRRDRACVVDVSYLDKHLCWISASRRARSRRPSTPPAMKTLNRNLRAPGGACP
jgi:hypothetical protein